MRTSLLTAFFFTCTLVAQSPLGRPTPVVWNGQDLHVFEDPNVTIYSQDGRASTTLNCPWISRTYDYFDGAHWLASGRRISTPNLKDGRVSSLYKYTESKWIEYGHYEHIRYSTSYMRILGNGDIWAYTRIPGLFSDDQGKSYPICILEKHHNSNRLKIKSLCDLGMNKPFFHVDKWDPTSKVDRLNYPGFLWDSSDPMAMRTDDFIILCFPESGYFWIFDGQNGKLKRKVVLYPFVDEEMLTRRHKDLAPSILAAHPRQDGRILISARSEDAVRQAAQLYKNHRPAIHSDEDFIKYLPITKELQNLNLTAYPRIVWWLLDPKTGSIQEEVAPANFPAFVRNLDELNAFRWRFKPDGNLLLLGSYKNQERAASTDVKKTGTAYNTSNSDKKK